MLHCAGLSHTYKCLNAHGLIWAHSTEITQIGTVYKELCLSTDKHSFFEIVNHPGVTLPTGQYKRGPYIRFDWQNPNHTYKGVNPATPLFYHLMEASVSKDVFYDTYLTARAKPFGDKCVPEELVHGVQAVDATVDCTLRIFFTIQHYLHQIGLEVQDVCTMLDPTGRTMWSEINQDCMRIKQRKINGQDVCNKDIWRAGGSSVKAQRPPPRALRDADADAVLEQAVTPSGSKAIGVRAEKYEDRTDAFILSHLGVKLIRPEGRCLRVAYEVVDAVKLAKALGEGVNVHFVSARPRDMPGLLTQGRLDGTVTYSVVIDNYPTVARPVISLPQPDISLALISRRGQQIDPRTWTANKPARIASEHPRMVRSYLASIGVPQDTYKIQRVLGASESYLVNDPCETFLLCNAIAITGGTLKLNNLDVWKLVQSKGDVAIGLYQRL